MERRNFAALCAAVLCFWLFALAFGTAQGMGLHLVARREAKTASAQAVWVKPALPAAAAPALSLNCRAAILKANSPSCGHGTIYDGTFSGKKIPGSGVAAELLEQNGIAVYTDEDCAAALPF